MVCKMTPIMILATVLATAHAQSFLTTDHTYRQVMTTCFGEDLFYGLIKTLNDVLVTCSQEEFSPENAPPLDYPALFDTLARTGLRPQPLPAARPPLSPGAFSQFVPPPSTWQPWPSLTDSPTTLAPSRSWRWQSQADPRSLGYLITTPTGPRLCHPTLRLHPPPLTPTPRYHVTFRASSSAFRFTPVIT
nr:proline-rich receptor-like protein kinase PERK2 [Penaeus vannamei]